MLHTVVVNIIFFAAALSLLTSFGQLFLRGRKEENENLFFLFFILGLVLLQSGSIITGDIYNYPALFFLNMTFMSLLGPILFRAYFYVTFPVKDFPFSHGLIFIPSLFILVVDIYYLSICDADKTALIRNVLEQHYTTITRIAQFVYVVSLLQAVFFLSYLVGILVKEFRKDRSSPILYVNTAYTFLTMLVFCVVNPGIIFGSETLIEAGSMMAATLLIGAYLVGFRHPEFLQLFFVNAVTGRKNSSLASNIDTEEIREQLNRMMKEDKLYREEDISLQNLADELSITPHQLSFIINTSFSMNFNNFINSFRVEEALLRLLETPDQSILSIAHEVGFNSKSAFYAAFTHFTGTTPSQFRKEKQSGRLN